ncbi:Histone-lysine N-methyltransferase SUVR4 [Hibiscus syriacus]|uniref:Histone-lysine N-methyltransferase SUVR4 n=1 Tax=Hibiscus syriacus TaxID=106335 RepID=A0A6A2X851_HIBSY|nr:Histone-lysine N-methyltransferase SUVR4 [Hibiscus syriacus]
MMDQLWKLRTSTSTHYCQSFESNNLFFKFGGGGDDGDGGGGDDHGGDNEGRNYARDSRNTLRNVPASATAAPQSQPRQMPQPLFYSMRGSHNYRACKGHLMRKFIKECWDKCGCSKRCGNRVVQRGITASLQVFSTPEGKGWGLRAVNALKKGTFVRECVGEIVTNHELHLINNQRSGEEEHTYPVLLDADWSSERVLKDEEALCLDATKYGNWVRFINHRYVDSNLVEFLVEIEIPDHHYYHVQYDVITTTQMDPEVMLERPITRAKAKQFREAFSHKHIRPILGSYIGAKWSMKQQGYLHGND